MKTHLARTYIFVLFGLFITSRNAAASNEYSWTQSSGTISYMGNQYVDNIDDVYTITTGVGNAVSIHYSVSLESYYDLIYIYTINESETPVLVGSYSGVTEGTMTVYASTGKIMLAFTTDSSICYASGGGYGFYVNFNALSGYGEPNVFSYEGNTVIPSGRFGVGTSLPQTLFQIDGTTDTSPTNHGLMVLGSTNASNISFDQNEIMARNNGVASALYLNHEGGNILLNGTNAAGGNVAIGTTSATQRLSIYGGSASITPYGIAPIETYGGNLMLTKPAASGQYINLSRIGNGNSSWSIGTVYNSNTFAIGLATSNDANFNSPFFNITKTGLVGIGTANPAYLLDVKGTIRAAEVKIVSVDQFADFVFDRNYRLPKLSDVSQYISNNGHLPEIPSASEVKKDGMSLVDMQIKLLQKVEELTLYAIDQQKRLDEQSRTVAAQQKRIEELEKNLYKKDTDLVNSSCR